MTTLHALLIEFNAVSVEDLIRIVGILVDWYTKRLYDNPWDSWASVCRDRYQNLLDMLIIIPDDADIDPKCCLYSLNSKSFGSYCFGL